MILGDGGIGDDIHKLYTVVVTILLAICGWIVARLWNTEKAFKDRADEIIAERMEMKTATLKMSIDTLSAQITAMNSRLSAGDARFDAIVERYHNLDRKMLEEIGNLKEVMHRECCSPEDLKTVSEDLKAVREMLDKITRGPVN